MGGFSTWFERNYKKLLILSLLWLATIYTINTAIELKEYGSFKEVAKNEVQKWLSTHNISVTINQQPRPEEHTIVMSESVLQTFQSMIVLLFVLMTALIMVVALVTKG